MELSLICIKQIIIMFILVGVGFICGRTKLIDRQTNSKLSSFVLDVVNPVLIFMSYQQAFDTELLKNLGLSVLLALCSYALILIVLGVIFAKDRSSGSVIARFAAVYSNCGFMGIPLIRAIFGAEGVLYLTGYLTIFHIFVWTHGLSMFSDKVSPKKILS
ncbi:MAG: AEC family transporter, partial [Oscillospiraceae bacterium]|nr:AEC family transporter [Oscillospiraceae bacterium]